MSDLEELLAEIVRPNERIVGQARATSGLIVTTDQKVIVARSPREPALLPIRKLRRIQFDMEFIVPSQLAFSLTDAPEPVVTALDDDDETVQWLAMLGAIKKSRTALDRARR